MSSLLVTLLSHPNSKYQIDWLEELASCLTHSGISLDVEMDSTYRIPQTWVPSFGELVTQLKYEYLMTTRYLQTDPRVTLSLKRKLRVRVTYLAQLAMLLLRPGYRDLKKRHGRRNLDISFAYLAQKPKIDNSSAEWLLSFEDDAKPLVPLSVAAGIISEFLEQDCNGIWLIDLSKSFTSEELSLGGEFLSPSDHGGVEFIRVSGRTSSTFCSILIPRITWASYLAFLSSAAITPGLRLVPCDWLFEMFAQGFSIPEGDQFPQTFTYLTEQGVFNQVSLTAYREGLANPTLNDSN